MSAFRPRLVIFRVARFLTNYSDAARAKKGSLEIEQNIEVGIQIPSTEERPIRAAVRIQLNAKVEAEEGISPADFSAEYLAKFNFRNGTTIEEVRAWVDEEPNQYALISQAFPLAMTHFKRELMAAGMDAPKLPIGI